MTTYTHLLEFPIENYRLYDIDSYNNAPKIADNWNFAPIIVMDFGNRVDKVTHKIDSAELVAGVTTFDLTEYQGKIYGNVIYDEEPRENVMIAVYDDRNSDRKVGYALTNKNGDYMIRTEHSGHLYYVTAEDLTHKYNRQIKGYTIAEPEVKKSSNTIIHFSQLLNSKEYIKRS